MLDIRCPSCGRESAVAESYAGREVNCPSCQEPYIAGSVRANRNGAGAFEFAGDYTSAAQPRGPRGIGGWLILPAIGLVLGPLVHVISILISMAALAGPDMAAIEAKFPGIRLAILGEIAATVVLLLFQLFTAVMFFMKKAMAPKLMIALYALNLFLAVIFAMWTTSVLGKLEPDTAKDTTRAIIVACIWIPYFLVSRRVKATFVNP